MRIPAMLAAAACLVMVGCADGQSSAYIPGDAASAAAVDAGAAIAAETAYAAVAMTGAKLVEARVIDKERFRAIDRTAWYYIQAERQAYAAGNERDFIGAQAGIEQSVRDMQALIKGAQ